MHNGVSILHNRVLKIMMHAQLDVPFSLSCFFTVSVVLLLAG